MASYLNWARRGARLAIISLLSLAPLMLDQGTAGAKDEEEDKIDYLSLSARLIADGKYDRAQQMLDEVDIETEDLDLPKYYTLKGILFLKRGSSEEAIKSFDASLKVGQTDPAIHLYLAQAHFALKDYKKTLKHLDEAGAVAEQSPAAFGMRAQAYWEMRKHGAAFSTLEKGMAKFPKDVSLGRSRIFYLIELGLYQEVVRVSGSYLQKEGVGVEEYLAIGEALRRGRQLEKAQGVLQAAKLRFPHNAQVAVALAHTYVDEEKVLSAAMLFEEAARYATKYALEAAELYKSAGRTELALAQNSRIVDQKEKLKQRLGLLLDSERYELVAGMSPALSRNGLLEDGNVRYALAYGLFKVGDFEGAESQLKKIADPGLFRSSMQLRRAMASCREAGWECQ